MGVVVRQGSKFMVVSIVGLSISTLSTLFIYPQELETYGNVQFLINMSRVILPLISLGALAIPVRFFPEYSNSNHKSELLGFGFLYLLLAVLAFLLIYPLIQNGLIGIMGRLDMDSEKYVEYDQWIILLSFLTGMYLFLQYYISNFQRIVIPGVIVELSIKIMVPCLILWKILWGVPMMTVIKLFVGWNLLILILLVVYLRFVDSIKVSWPGRFTGKHLRSIINYSSYGLFNTLGINLVYRIDIIMITVMLGASTTGQYSIFLFIASVTGLPAMGLYNISAPLISQAFVRKDYEKIKSIYTNISMILMMFSGLIGVVIYAGIRPLFSIMENGQSFIDLLGVWVILVLTKWIDHSTGMNMHIISYSPFYRYNLIFLVVFGISTVGLNYIFIEKYGVYGAAGATFISVVVYNLVKLMLIYYKMKIWSFTKNSYAIILVLACLIVILYHTPHLPNPFIDIILRCGLTGLVGGLLFYKLNLVSEYNKIINVGINFIKGRL